MKLPTFPAARPAHRLFGWLWVSFLPNLLWAQLPPPAEPAEPAARVAGFEIRPERVEAYLRQTVPSWPVAVDQQARLRTAATEHLINRQLALLAIKQKGIQAAPAELEWKLDELRAELQRLGRSLEEHLAAVKLTREELNNGFDWEVAWPKYLAQTLTEARLLEEFRARPRDFDGTELHVAQILLAREPGNDQSGSLSAAERLRQRLVRGELEWSAAVLQHSIAPSRELGGDLGWIRRREPMPEAFSRSAFALDVGEISVPLTSVYGIHLIKCLGIRPGKAQFGDAREEVYRATMEREYRRLAEEMRLRVEVWVCPQE